MFSILKKFFAFCSEENQKKFYISIALGVVAALFLALKIPAIAVILQAILAEQITTKVILLSLGIMLLSIVGASLVKHKATMLQTEAGYGTAAGKRIEIAEHMRYLPMGYFNENSLGYITSVCTNTMENLADVGTRVVMMMTEGLFSTLVITAMLFFFDVKVGVLVVAGILVYFLANRLLQRAARSRAAEKTRTDAALVEKVLEYIKGIAEVKSYNLSGKYNRRMEQAVDENVKANTDMEIALIPYMTLQNLIAKLIGTAIALLSLYEYTQGQMSLLYYIMMVICAFLVTEGLEKAGTNSALIRIVDACVDKADDIMALPKGYDTVIGESGGTLSGGERQRLSIARAMMKDAPIIILDEATANVDPENEKDLMTAIEELTREKTIIMIAHRLKTVRDADQILIMDQGRIVQNGDHDSLMEEDGIYRNFICGRQQAVSWKL